ncbi:Protein stoned-A [Orchesella cincta]|uniref:Protein stoned-A n=1 Tax=Orchesella cincta TaxID=48709 RepID=A0A1D2MMH9_ORCCI|nr:Protein stoned-A [Orchesella cincta]
MPFDFSDFRVMLKGVKKGIKKKIKGKKDKKEDDLFDPEQLEKYKRELEEAKKARQQQDEESGSTAAGSSAGHEDDEEWLRFKQLTSGVDALVNKASDDLDKIKESSFFQRNKPSEQNMLFARPKDPVILTPDPEQPPEGAKWVHIEGANNAEHEEVTEADGAFGTDTTDDAFNTAAQVPESPEEVIPVELDDSLFDTTFTDAIAAGEIKLAYIPDSPTHDDEDDPFNTAIFDDVVKKIEEDEKRQAKQVNLGCAVDVLTGKGDKTGIARPRTKAAETKAKARPRPHAINLLGDFDAEMPPSAPSQSGSNMERPKDIFDQILDAPSQEVTIDIMASREIQRKKDSDAASKEDKGIKDVISEFDIISQLDPICGSAEAEPLPSGVPSSIPSSIAALLITSTAPPPEEDDDLDDEFAALAAESIHKGPSPASIVPTTEVEEEVEPAAEDDPFDTSYVEKTAAHGKCELKILENEFLGDVTCEKGEGGSGGGTGGGDDDDDFDFNPRLGESPPKTLEIQNAPKKNPLEDMSPMTGRAPTIEPEVKAVGPALVETSEGEAGGHDDLDPFTTDHIETVLPGKAELKLLEAELLSSVEQAKVQPPKLPDAISSVLIKNQQPTQDEDDFDFDPRKDEFKHHPLDLPDVGVDNVDTASKVLTPQLDIEVEVDPFNTDFATGLIPGKLELKLLENELVSPTKEAPVNIVPVQQAPVAPVKFPRTFSDDDFDFDPREGKPAPTLPVKPPQTTEELFDSTMDFAVDKPLTPQQEMPSTAIPESKICPMNMDDPFETSHIDHNYLAKSELKQVEEELLNAPPEPVRQTRQLPVIVAVEYKQPPQPVVPELPPEPEIPHPFEANTPVDDSFKPLTPVEISSAMSGVISVFNPSPMADPFMTDHVIPEGLLPGKTEIKLLEEELGVTAGLERRLSDPDFDPRQPNHPSNQMVSHPLTPMPAQKAPVVSDGSDPFVTSMETSMPGLHFLSSNPFHNDNVDNRKIPISPDLPCVPLHVSNPFRTSQSIAAINETCHFPKLPKSYGIVDVNNNNPFLFPNFASQNPK